MIPVNIYGDIPNDILNIARSRLSDMILTPQGYPGGSDPGAQFTEVGGGTINVGVNPDGTLILRTQVIFNSAYLKFQKYLANLGYRELVGDNLVIGSLPINQNVDPSVQSWLSWNGFFNGTTFTATPAFPQDFYAPLKIRARPSGQNAIFRPMRCALDGLRPVVIRPVCEFQWEWRNNALYLSGATLLNDLQFRYIRRLQTLPDPNYASASPALPWFFQPLTISGCKSAMAWYVIYEALLLRTDETAAAGAALALTNAESEANSIFNDQARADQRTNCRRRPRGGRGRGVAWGLF